MADSLRPCGVRILRLGDDIARLRGDIGEGCSGESIATQTIRYKLPPAAVYDVRYDGTRGRMKNCNMIIWDYYGEQKFLFLFYCFYYFVMGDTMSSSLRILVSTVSGFRRVGSYFLLQEEPLRVIASAELMVIERKNRR
jgi:hypothetical protein